VRHILLPGLVHLFRLSSIAGAGRTPRVRREGGWLPVFAAARPLRGWRVLRHPMFHKLERRVRRGNVNPRRLLRPGRAPLELRLRAGGRPRGPLWPPVYQRHRAACAGPRRQLDHSGGADASGRRPSRVRLAAAAAKASRAAAFATSANGARLHAGNWRAGREGHLLQLQSRERLVYAGMQHCKLRRQPATSRVAHAPVHRRAGLALRGAQRGALHVQQPPRGHNEARLLLGGGGGHAGLAGVAGPARRRPRAGERRRPLGQRRFRRLQRVNPAQQRALLPLHAAGGLRAARTKRHCHLPSGAPNLRGADHRHRQRPGGAGPLGRAPAIRVLIRGTGAGGHERRQRLLQAPRLLPNLQRKLPGPWRLLLGPGRRLCAGASGALLPGTSALAKSVAAEAAQAAPAARPRTPDAARHLRLRIHYSSHVRVHGRPVHRRYCLRRRLRRASHSARSRTSSGDGSGVLVREEYRRERANRIHSDGALLPGHN
jgi:hypothetical protein